MRVPGWTYREAIPGWLDEECVPVDLYWFLDAKDTPFAISVNGESVLADIGTIGNGYISLRRAWQTGDKIELFLPVSAARIVSDERVEADRGRVALQYGPLVYCAEWADNGGSVLDLVLPDDAPLSAQYEKDLLGGVTTVRGKAERKGEPVDFTAIPYYAWANRGKGEMTVWLKRGESEATKTGS